MTTPNTMPTSAEVIAALKTIFDPEIPVDIYELGLIYEVKIDSERKRVDIDMTLTSPNCPVAESLPRDVEDKVMTLEGVEVATVEVVFEPPWTKDMISEEARLELGFL
jgi:FeS assembly SUF system protein|tara:strand:- start:8 stop:331 length:324 start_codon:yes stop_codon:yes gene_type:complete